MAVWKTSWTRTLWIIVKMCCAKSTFPDKRKFLTCAQLGTGKWMMLIFYTLSVSFSKSIVFWEFLYFPSLGMIFTIIFACLSANKMSVWGCKAFKHHWNIVLSSFWLYLQRQSSTPPSVKRNKHSLRLLPVSQHASAIKPASYAHYQCINQFTSTCLD